MCMIDHSWRWGAGDVEFAAKNGPVSWHRPQLGVTPSASPRQWACRHGQSHLVLHTDPDQVADARSIQQLEAGHERERGSMQSGE